MEGDSGSSNAGRGGLSGLLLGVLFVVGALLIVGIFGA